MTGMNKILIAATVVLAGVLAWNLFLAGHSDDALTPVTATSVAKKGLISSGEAVDLGEHAQAKGYTVFEFMAPW